MRLSTDAQGEPGPMPRYVDPYGNLAERPPDVSPEWRVMCSAVAMRGGKLLMRRAAWSGLWEIPGGGVELAAGESILEGVVREVREETGYTFVPDASTLRFRGEQLFHVPSSNAFYHSLNFLVLGTAHGASVPASHPGPEESLCVDWLDPRSLTTADTHWFHLGILRELNLLPS